MGIFNLPNSNKEIIKNLFGIKSISDIIKKDILHSFVTSLDSNQEEERGQVNTQGSVQESKATNTEKLDNSPVLIDESLYDSITSSGGETEDSNLDPDKTKLTTSDKLNIIGKTALAATDIISTAFVNKSEFAANDPTVNGTGRLLYDATANALMQFSPIGTVAGGAMKVVGLANDLLGSKTLSFAIDADTLNTVGGSYGGASSLINDAANASEKKYGLFAGGARKKANNLINKARKLQTIMSNISKDALDFAASSTFASNVNALNYQYQINGGYDQRYLRAAKEGTKLNYFNEDFSINLSNPDNFDIVLSELPLILKKGGTLLDKLDFDYLNQYTIILSDIKDISSFKKGGNLDINQIDVIETDTTQKSVIPEGTLHKNKHNLDLIGLDDSKLTKKGIPVVDNYGNQQAEIELNEIIFTLEVTKELEKRYKEYYNKETSQSEKDKLALEAGKLLWKEILFNTDDRTGLISTLKKGGNINLEDKENSKCNKEISLELIELLVKQALINILTK